MEINECHRLLELDRGASREAIDAAYARLLKRWHPDQVTPAGDPAGLQEAARMTQAVTEAYETLVNLTTPPWPPVVVAPRKKPVLPTTPQPQELTRKPPPPPANPLPGTATPPAAPLLPKSPSPAEPPAAPPAASRGEPSMAAVPPPPPKPPSPIAAPLPPPPPPAPVSREKSAPPPAARPAGAAPKVAPSLANLPFSLRAKILFNGLFPAGSPARRYGLVLIPLALVALMAMGKCAFSASNSRSNQSVVRPVDPTKNSRVSVRSNLPNTELQLVGPASFSASGEEASWPAVPPGSYVLSAKAEGWPDLRQEVTVEIGHPTEVAVAFQGGALRLESDPPGATVRIGGNTVGKTPLTLPLLPPGECKLTLEYPFWPALAYTTTITTGGTTTESVRLPHGKLTVETIPAGATVLLGGRAVGQTPLTLERVPAGPKKIVLQAKNYPPLNLAVTVEDRADVNLTRDLGLGFPELDAPGILRAVWVPDDPNRVAPPMDSLGIYEPRNGVVKNLHRKRLYESALNRRFRYTATIKSYDRDSGRIEFNEQANALSKYRVLADLSPAARNNPDYVASLVKGASVSVHGQLTAVEEPRWPFKLITFELSGAEPVR